MKFGLVSGLKIGAEPTIKNATCSLCGEKLIPKCGNIKIWHFAHQSNTECDNWAEPESEWHLNWKDKFPKEQQEVVISKCISNYCDDPKYNHNHLSSNHGNCNDCVLEKHRADIKVKNLIVELQNSPLSSKIIEEREYFYSNQVGNIIWIVNGKNLFNGLQLRQKGNITTFRWKHPSKSWWKAKKRIYIDLQNGFLFLIKKVYQNMPCGGWGIIIEKEHLINEVNNGELQN